MKRTVLCGCVPAALGAFDFGLLALAGPRVAVDVGAIGDAYPWLFSASAFAYGAAVLPAAAITTRLGASRALAAGLGMSAVGAAGFALSSALAPALAARAAFGIGGAIAATAALALLATLAPEATRRAAFAALGGAVGAGFAAGTLAATLPSWNAVMLALAALCACTAGLAVGLPPSVDPERPRPLRGATPLAGAIVLVALTVAVDAPLGIVTAIPAAAAALIGLRRAAVWLPPRGSGMTSVCLAGAATTAGGVAATILTGAELAAADRPTALLAIFGLAVVPGARLARSLAARRGHAEAAAAGLALQACGLCALAAALAWSQAPVLLAGAVLVFGLGHVAANGATAGAASALPGRSVPARGSLLIAAQYVGGGVGTMALSPVAAGAGVPVAVLAAAAIALVGAFAALRAAGLSANGRAFGALRDESWAVPAGREMIE